MCGHPQMARYSHKLEFSDGTGGCHTCFTIQELRVKARNANVEPRSHTVLFVCDKMYQLSHTGKWYIFVYTSHSVRYVFI